MPRQLFFLHTSENLLKVSPAGQTAWLREVRRYFASTWKEDETASLPAAFVFVPLGHQTGNPPSIYGRFQQAVFSAVPWMQFKRTSIWGMTTLDAGLSAEFWRLTRGQSAPSPADPVMYQFVIIRDPTAPHPRKHPDWLIHGYPTWTDHSAALRIARRSMMLAHAPHPGVTDRAHLKTKVPAR